MSLPERLAVIIIKYRPQLREPLLFLLNVRAVLVFYDTPMYVCVYVCVCVQSVLMCSVIL